MASFQDFADYGNFQCSFESVSNWNFWISVSVANGVRTLKTTNLNVKKQLHAKTTIFFFNRFSFLPTVFQIIHAGESWKKQNSRKHSHSTFVFKLPGFLPNIPVVKFQWV